LDLSGGGVVLSIMVNGEAKEIEFTADAVRYGRLVIPIRPETAAQ